MPRQGSNPPGGRSQFTARTTPGYSPGEITAMSKLSHLGGERTGEGAFGGDPNHVVLCKLCGRPISSPSPYDRTEDRFDYYDQAKVEAHFNCHIANSKRKADQAAKALANLSPEQKMSLEDLEAERFNNGNQVAPESALEQPKPKPYQFKPGERPIEKGLPKDDKFEFTPESDPNILAKMSEREKQEREEFELYMKQQSKPKE